jgi:ATP-dependent Lhr-like helicase
LPPKRWAQTCRYRASIPGRDIEAALTALQTEGYAISMPAAEGSGKRWCERRLLARIHRYSRDRRRKSSRAVPPAAFMRFLTEWHGLDEPAGELEQVLALLEGWAAPAGAWEQDLLASRCADYSSRRLDEQFLSGFVTWFRPPVNGQGNQQIVAATPIAIVPRRHANLWQTSKSALAREKKSTPPPQLTGPAAKIHQILSRKGAMFSIDLEQETGLLQPQLEQAVSSLIAQGLITADAFSPLRWLMRPDREKRRHEKASRRRRISAGTGLLGRWSALGGDWDAADEALFADQALLATVCDALLRRYGVVFRAVLEREMLLPPWRVLLRYLRRMEDRGEVYGGRFVDGFSGEQFALPEAVGLLRRHARAQGGSDLRVINATDPLNLGGIITAGVKTPAKPGNRILLENGIPAARVLADEVELLGGAESVNAAVAERYLTVAGMRLSAIESSRPRPGEPARKIKP